MNTPKTPMERAEDYLNDYDNTDKPKNIARDAYLAGDADRERLMKEGASRGFDDWCEGRYPEGYSFDLHDLGKAWTAARADRAELIACVLEMAAYLSIHLPPVFNEMCEGCRESTRMGSRVLAIHDELIRKLKAEKDAV